MPKYKIDFSDFELPFLDEPGYVLEEGTSDVETMIWKLPKEAVILGRTQYETSNWTSWESDDIYIILPLDDTEWDYALFRISWDDNYSCWAWSQDCRIKGEFKNLKKPAWIMIEKCCEEWQIDITKPENKSYLKLINRVKRMKI
jgi:hypothetical protein